MHQGPWTLHRGPGPLGRGPGCLLTLVLQPATPISPNPQPLEQKKLVDLYESAATESDRIRITVGWLGVGGVRGWMQ